MFLLLAGSTMIKTAIPSGHQLLSQAVQTCGQKKVGWYLRETIWLGTSWTTRTTSTSTPTCQTTSLAPMEEVRFHWSPLNFAQVSWSLFVTPRSRSTHSIWRARTTTKTDRHDSDTDNVWSLSRCLPCHWPTTTDRESWPGACCVIPPLLIGSQVQPEEVHRAAVPSKEENPFLMLTRSLNHSSWGVSATRTSTTMFCSTTR